MKNDSKAIIIAFLALLALVMFHQLYWYNKKITVEHIDIKVMQDDIFNPLNEKLELIYKIAKPMIQSFKTSFSDSIKDIEGESVTLETFLNKLKKEYNGAWDGVISKSDKKAYGDFHDKIISEGTVALMNNKIQKELGKTIIEQGVFICMVSKLKSPKIIKIVPIYAYTSIDKDKLCLYAVLCNENDIVIGCLEVR